MNGRLVTIRDLCESRGLDYDVLVAEVRNEQTVMALRLTRIAIERFPPAKWSLLFSPLLSSIYRA